MSYKIAGIDVHKKMLMVVVIDASTPEGKPERRRFARKLRYDHWGFIPITTAATSATLRTGDLVCGIRHFSRILRD
jgi:hypothetical protein